MVSYFLARSELSKVKRMVIKIGTNTITTNGKFNIAFAKNLADEITILTKQGKEIILISSGAIHLGNNHLCWEKTNYKTAKQCSASVGQNLLMQNYYKIFSGKMFVSQLLLTRADLKCTERKNFVKQIINHSIANNILTVINENDSLSTEKITFGDNDILSAHVTNVIGADLLVLLTNVDGIYSNIERKQKISYLKDIKAVQHLVSYEISKNGTGGMNSKLMAANIVSYCGAKTVIANGLEKNRITRLLDGEDIGTLIDL
jgi:glutamate 5-kinase